MNMDRARICEIVSKERVIKNNNFAVTQRLYYIKQFKEFEIRFYFKCHMFEDIIFSKAVEFLQYKTFENRNIYSFRL